jgi:hypothetical protein
MTDRTKLALIKAAHTIIYLVMAAATLFILYAGIAKYRGPLLTVALVLSALEAVVFVGNGFKCPLTALAQRYGAVKGYAFDTFLPEKWTKYTFRFFGTILVVGLALLLLNR